MKTIDRVLDDIDVAKHSKLKSRLRASFHPSNMYSRNQIKAQIVKAFIDMIDIDRVFKDSMSINIKGWFEWAQIKLIKQRKDEDRQEPLFCTNRTDERLYRAIPY